MSYQAHFSKRERDTPGMNSAAVSRAWASCGLSWPADMIIDILPQLPDQVFKSSVSFAGSLMEVKRLGVTANINYNHMSQLRTLKAKSLAGLSNSIALSNTLHIRQVIACGWTL